MTFRGFLILCWAALGVACGETTTGGGRRQQLPAMTLDGATPDGEPAEKGGATAGSGGSDSTETGGSDRGGQGGEGG